MGQTEEQLRQDGIAYKVGRMKFSDVERASANGHVEGLVKLLVDAHGKILGCHILGEQADTMIAVAIVAMQAGMHANKLADTIIPYPTLSEAIRWAADRID